MAKFRITTADVGETGAGGGMYGAENSYIIVNDANSLITGNSSDYGGGVYSTGYVYMDAGMINYNTASEKGGGIFCADMLFEKDGASDPEVAYNETTSITQGTGAGVYVSGGTCYFDCGTIHHNRAYWSGGFGGYDYDLTGIFTSHDRYRVRNFGQYIYENSPEDD